MPDHSICICVSRDSSWASRFIRFWSRAKVSHAFITFRSMTLGRVFAMESTATGFRLTPWSKWKAKHTLVARYEVKATQAKQLFALRNVSGYLGTKYDYKSLLGFFWRILTGRLRKNRFNSSSKLICSEAVALFLYQCGLVEFERPETWTPGDIYKEAENNQKLVVVESE